VTLSTVVVQKRAERTLSRFLLVELVIVMLMFGDICKARWSWIVSCNLATVGATCPRDRFPPTDVAGSASPKVLPRLGTCWQRTYQFFTDNDLNV